MASAALNPPYLPVAGLVDLISDAPSPQGRQAPASRPSRKFVVAAGAALGLLALTLATRSTLPAGLLRRMRASAGQVANEMKLAGRQFCCLAAADAGDPCGSCWDGAVNLDSSWCGEAEDNCMGCGNTAFWCEAETPEPTASPTPAPTPSPPVVDDEQEDELPSGALIDFASRPDASMYCISLIMPRSDEGNLTQAQLAAGVGMFSCNAFTVYSNEHFVLQQDPMVSTEVIPGSLEVERGGVWFTALNSDVFARLWKTVFEGGRYTAFDWTIKLDADTVFFPDRMRAHLRQGGSYPERSYFNNCKIDDMHGPIEVLSRGAMDKFQEGLQRCRDDEVTDESQWGEDVFVRQCLDYLGVVKVNDWELLSETACAEDLSGGCVSGKVAFHPFKDADSYFKCMDEATAGETTVTTTPTGTSTMSPAPTLSPDAEGGADRPEGHWLADDSELEAETLGLAYRRTPHLEDMLDTEWAPWGSIITGAPSEDGDWLVVGNRFLPMKLKGVQVLKMQELWKADNSKLKAPTVGLGYRRSKSLDDKRAGDSVLWGDVVEGSPTVDGEWLQVGARFLPTHLRGDRVLRKVKAAEGESVDPTSAAGARHGEAAEGAPGDHREKGRGGALRIVAA